MNDALFLALSEDGLLRARAARTTALVDEALRRHRPGPLGALALARALSVAAVFPVEWDKNDRVSLQWSGGGPLGTVLAELRSPGDLRAYLTRPEAEPRGTKTGKARGYGLGLLPGGFLSVLRQAPRGGHVQGQVPLLNGEVDEDLEVYFEASEQVPTRVRALIDLDDDGAVRAAGAVLVQRMPEAEASDLVPGRLLEGLSPHDAPSAWLEAAFGRPFRVLEERPLVHRCPCSRERVEAGLALLGEDELIDMMVKDQGAQVTCQFCAEEYRFSATDLAAILDLRLASSSSKGQGEA